jgi:hypothetical protein
MVDEITSYLVQLFEYVFKINKLLVHEKVFTSDASKYYQSVYMNTSASSKWC